MQNRWIDLLILNKLHLLSIFLFVTALFSAYHSSEKVRYFHAQTIVLPADTVYAYPFDFKEGISIDTLFQIRSKEGYPISYFRNLKTDVCFDKKCRMLNVKLYWNITGRYLGLELPKGEFLSKTDHEPFTEQEYARLSSILADSLSPLRGLSYNELVPQSDPEVANVDAISAPTSPDVLDYVVKGAVYTTYKLWHFVYGTTQNEIEKLTRAALTPGFLLQILKSPDLSDKIWALNHSAPYLSRNAAIQKNIFSLISHQNYNLAERAINAIDLKTTSSDTLQRWLFEKFTQSDYALKKLILNKLKESSPISSEVAIALAQQLKSLNGELLGDVLAIYKKNNVNDIGIYRIIAGLLENENAFIAQKAYKFLENKPLEDKALQSKMTKYKLKVGIVKG